MFAHPFTSHLRMASRFAVTGLAAVLIFLGVFALWSSHRSVSSVSRLERSRVISNAYAEAHFATNEERLLEHQYMLIYGGNYSAASAPGLHAKLNGFANQVITALVTLERLGDRSDGRLAGRLLATEQAYQAAVDEVLVDAATGDRARARVHESIADQSFNQIKSELAKAAAARSRQSLEQLKSLRRTESAIGKETVVAVPLGLLLVCVFWLVLRAYRRRAGEYTAAELARLKQEALVDSLTHLRNHRAFHEDLDHALAQADRSGRAVTLVLIDLDHLKQVNDTHGHQGGDERLKALAEAARRASRTSDGAYRVGGDEFAMIMPETRARLASALFERLRAELSLLTDGRQTATAGIAEFGPGIDRDQLVHNADSAMLEAKMTRRNVLIYSSELESSDKGRPIDGARLRSDRSPAPSGLPSRPRTPSGAATTRPSRRPAF
jgi:diguanylate cyclase (GGDEF)-like protein